MIQICAVALLLGACTPAIESRALIHVEDNKLFLAGTLDHGAKPLVLAALDDHPLVDTIVFTVAPGSVDDECTLALGREIRARGLHTRLIDGGVLVSGGVSLFLAGATRAMDGAATVGVHSWEGCTHADGQAPQCRDAIDYPLDDPAHRLHQDYVREMLGSDGFYLFSIRAAPSDSVHWMSREEIGEFGLAPHTPGEPDLNVPDHLHPDALVPRMCRNCPPR